MERSITVIRFLHGRFLKGPDEPDIPETDAYTISASKNSEITLGEDAEVTLTVTHNEETVYNAYFINVTYDAEKLIYKGINTEATVKDENGTLTMQATVIREPAERIMWFSPLQGRLPEKQKSM